MIKQTALEIVKPYGLSVRDVAKEWGVTDTAIHVLAGKNPHRLLIMAAGIKALKTKTTG